MYKGELYITGRRKDMIIVRGRNLYPHGTCLPHSRYLSSLLDIEESIRISVSEVRPGGITVFAIDVEDEEKLVAVVEVKDVKAVNTKQIAKDIFRVVSKNHTISCHAVVVANPGTVKKTTSGKLKRQATREEYLKGNLPKGFLLSDVSNEIQVSRR